MIKSSLAIFFVFIVFSANTQTQKTENPAQKRLHDIVSLINNYSIEEASNYIRNNYSPGFLQTQLMEEHRGLIARINDEGKNVLISSIDLQKPNEANALVQIQLTGAWRQLIVRTEPSSPYRVAFLQMQLANPPKTESAKSKPATDSAASKELDSITKKLEKENIFSGNVLVARNGQIVFHKAYGLASKEFDFPNNLSTKFIIGSINKMFTTVGILQLVEKNKISLENLVSDILPGILSDTIAHRIKIKHLLTHTSGLGDFLFTAEMSQKSKENFRTIADYLPALAKDRLFFEPGTQWHYSNAGYLVLGAVIQKISGLSYEEYMLNNIYQPAGMVSTYFPELDNVNKGLADTYEKDWLTGKPLFHNTRYYQVIKGTPAGGGFSTCTDLFNFMQALAAGKLLKPETVKLMQTAKPEMKSPNYGFGTEIFDKDSFGHTGGGPGTNAVVQVNTKSGLTVVVLGNTNTGTNIVLRKALEFF